MRSDLSSSLRVHFRFNKLTENKVKNLVDNEIQGQVYSAKSNLSELLSKDSLFGHCLEIGTNKTHVDIPRIGFDSSSGLTITCYFRSSTSYTLGTDGTVLCFFDENSESDDFTISLKASALSSDFGVFTLLRGSGTHHFRLSNKKDQWIHLGIVIDKQGCLIYVDGVVKIRIPGTPSDTWQRTGVIKNFRIGTRNENFNSYPTQFFEGFVADLKIYGQTLSLEDIKYDMESTLEDNKSPELKRELMDLREELKKQHERYVNLNSNYQAAVAQVEALHAGATKAELTAQLDQAKSRIADNELKLKVSETQNILSSAHLKVSKLRESVEELGKDQTWDSPIKQAQQAAEQSASLSPGSAVAKKAKEFAELVPKKSKEAKDQADNAVDAANKTDQLLINLAKHVDEFYNLSLSNLPDPERTTKLAEVDDIRNYAEQILSAFTEAPAYSKVDDISEQQITNSNISSAVENTKKQILNIKFAANAVEQAKREAEEAVRMAKQQAEEAGKLYARNRNALDKLFGLTTDPEESSKTPANSKISIPSTSEPVQETLFKKSVKQLFGFKAEEGNSESGLERQPEEPDRSINEKENMSASQSS